MACLIPGTGGENYQNDAEFELADKAIKRLDLNSHQILVVEYTRLGTQQTKAAAMGIKRPNFLGKLKLAKLLFYTVYQNEVMNISNNQKKNIDYVYTKSVCC